MLRYIVITPIRNEESYIEKTIDSMTQQTIKPLEWIIVNDGSTDSTGRIIENYASKYSWIHAVHRRDRGFRQAGGGVIAAFYEGFKQIKSKEWDFIVKLDGDVSFEKDYFEKCFNEFERNAKLGICGGVILNEINGEYKIEKTPLYHVRGATKIYKKECWHSIEPLIKAPGWDTLDEIKANMLGWKTQTIPYIRLIHHRFTGEADGLWQASVKYGSVNYFMGYHPIFMIAKCFRRLLQRPYVISSVAIFYGYLRGYIMNLPRVDDEAIVKYVRQEQLKTLIFKKSIWR